MKLKINSKNVEKPYEIKKMGTSGMRATQDIYNRPLFLEQFMQGLADHFDSLPEETKEKGGWTIILGGDPRLGNKKRIKIAAEILVAKGFKVKIANDGLATTPAMSHAIRKFKALGGVILTASHNPYTDVGIKANSPDGAPSLQDAIDSIYNFQNSVKEISSVDYDEAMKENYIEEFDIIKQYGDLLDEIFDFVSMKKDIEKRKTPIKVALDSMHGAAGPFAREIFINRLNLDCKMIREKPDEYLGGNDENGNPMHPEPDFDYIKELIELNNSGKYDLVAAWDSDVDRRLDGGNGFFLESADEMALFSKYGDLIGIENLFVEENGKKGEIMFCRSTVTAHSIDLMEEFLKEHYGKKEFGVKVVETPTGFKWIAELGNWGVEESNGLGNPWIREKDGIFATVFLLKILLKTGKKPIELMEEIWKDVGRVYFTRGEVSGSESDGQERLTKILNSANEKVGKKFGELTLESTENWDYIHPISGKIAAKGAAWVLNFSDGNVIKARFSGTGSGGYLLRVYASKYDKKYDILKSTITQPMKEAFDMFLKDSGFNTKSKHYTDANQPDPYEKKT